MFDVFCVEFEVDGLDIMGIVWDVDWIMGFYLIELDGVEWSF